jgi:hypothetical protein
MSSALALIYSSRPLISSAVYPFWRTITPSGRIPSATSCPFSPLLSNYLSKLEAINMRDNYAAINDTTLTLNNELEITI